MPLRDTRTSREADCMRCFANACLCVDRDIERAAPLLLLLPVSDGVDRQVGEEESLHASDLIDLILQVIFVFNGSSFEYSSMSNFIINT